MNLKNSLEFINTVYQNHPLINDSWVGSIYDLNGRKNIKYPVASVAATDVTTQAHSIVYTLYLYYADRLTKDRSNTVDVQTVAINTLREVINYLQNNSDAFEVQSTNITLFEQKFQDECAGAYAVVRAISQDDIGNCSFSDEKIIEDFKGKTYLLDNYFTKSETLTLLDAKQDKLIAGENITIEGNVISATGGSTLTAGDGIDIANNEISVDGTIARKTDIIDSYTKSEVNTLLASKQDNLTAGENIEIENNVISVPHDVTLENIQSPSDSTAINIGSNPGQTKDNIYITAWGNSSDAQISMEGSGSDNESSSIAIEAYGYSDSNIQLRGGRQNISSTVNIYASGYSDSVIEMEGGTESDNKSSMLIAANGSTETAEIQMKGGDDDNMSVVNVNSEQFLYNDNDVAVVPINRPFVNGSIIYPENNHIYNGTNIARLTINGAGFTGDCLIQFTTGSTDPVVTITGVTFEDTPVFAINKYYEINIHNGHALWAEFTA